MIDTRINLNNNKFEQVSGETLNLSGCTNIYGQFSIKSGATISILNDYSIGKVLTSDNNGVGTWQISSVAWGNITGSLLDQIDLQNSLNSKLIWTGSTNNGIGTYVANNKICSEPNLTFDGTQLKTTGNIYATTCIISPLLSGGTISSTGSITGDIICGNSCIKSNSISGVTICGNSCVKSPLITGSTICGNNICGISTISTPKFIENGTCLEQKYLPFTMTTDMQDPTGFVDGSNINISYNYVNRTITLNGNLSYYWKGIKKTLTSPWTSSAHTATVGSWFLYSTDGNNFNWSQTPWDFNNIMVAGVYYQNTSGLTFAVRETHELMDWHSHEDLHNNIGTWLKSGGQAIAGTYQFNVDTDAAVTPSFNSAIIDDEDLATLIPQLDDVSGYTIMYVSGNTSIYSATTRPFLAAGSYIYYNNPITGALITGNGNRYYNIYQILVPATSDDVSQKYRMIFLLPQVEHTSLAAAQAEDTRGLNIGTLTTATPEFVIYTRITYSTSASYANYGKVVIPTGGITYVIGSKVSTISIGGLSPTNHANLTNLSWINSGHISNSDVLASFNSSGIAEALPKSYFSISGHTHPYLPLSGGTLTGELSGTTIQLSDDLIMISMTGSTNRLVQVDVNGKILATEIVLGKLTDATAISLLTDNTNWNIWGQYIGVDITGTYEGQYYRDDNYYYLAYADNNWSRLTLAELTKEAIPGLMSGDTPTFSSLYLTTMTGSTNRLVQANTNGFLSASTAIISGKITNPTVISLLSGDNNWDIDGNYIGIDITGTYEGQYYRNDDYFFFAYDNDDWTRTPRA